MSVDQGLTKSVIPADRWRLLEAEASWIGGLVLFFATVYVTIKMDMPWVAFGIAALCLYILPILSTRSPLRALPWEMTLLLAAPLFLHISEGSRTLTENLSWWRDVTSIAFAFSLTTIGFLLTVELHMYTPVRMNRPFAVFFVVMFTLAVSGFWQVGQWIDQVLYGADLLPSNTVAMKNLLWTLVIGLLMGFVYDLYMRAMPQKRMARLGFIHLWEVYGRTRKS